MKRRAQFPSASLETAICRVALTMDGDLGPNCIRLEASAPFVYQGRRYFMLRAYLQRRGGRWSLTQSYVSIWRGAERGADEETKKVEEAPENDRRALLDTIVPAALEYIDEHFEAFDRKRLERTIFEDNREQVVVCLRERIEALTAIADAARQTASGPYSPCQGPAFASVRKTLLAQSEKFRRLANQTRTMARAAATIPYSAHKATA